MSVQRHNPDLVKQLAAYFTRLNSPAHAWANAVSMALGMPGLISYLPPSTLGSGGGPMDISANGQEFTANGSAAVEIATANPLTPYCAFDGSGDSFSLADAAILDIAGTELGTSLEGLTMMSWVWFATDGSEEAIQAKWNTTGNQRSYRLIKTSSDTLRMEISSGGTVITVEQATSTLTANIEGWTFVAGKWTRSTDLEIFVGDTVVSNGSSGVSTLHSGTADYYIGSDNNNTEMDGRTAHNILCAAALPDAMITTFYYLTAPLFGVSV